MPFRLGKIAVVLMLVMATGGHWAMLQSVAWVGMAVRFSHDESLGVALEKTFSGKHPCKLCKAVSEGLKTEKAQKAQKLETKFDFFCSAPVAVLDAPSPEALPTYGAAIPHGWFDTPLVPPPRSA
jgi:hypothetical protein